MIANLTAQTTGIEIVRRAAAKELGLKRYFDEEPCPKGHVAERFVASYSCVVCAADYQRWKLKNRPEWFRTQSRSWRLANPEKARLMDARSNAKRRDYKKDYWAKWYAKNKERLKPYKRKYDKTYKRKGHTKLAASLRERLNVALWRWQAEKRVSAVRDLGCSIKEFEAHIARQFHSGMTWENRGTVWQLDHIEPLALLKHADLKQALRLVHYTNCQPLLIADHQAKSLQEVRQRAQSIKDAP